MGLRRRPKYRNSAAFVLQFVLLGIVLGPTAYGEPRAVLEVKGKPEDLRLSEIVARSAAIEAQKAGLALLLKGATVLPATPGTPAADSTAEYLLETSFDTSDDTVALAIRLYSADRKNQIAEAQATFPIRLDLDAGLATEFHSFFLKPEVRKAIAAAAEASPPGVSPQSPPKAQPTPGTAPPVAVTPDYTVRPGFTLAFSGAPFLLVGSASDYFRYGVRVEAAGGYRFELLHLSAQAQLEVGVVRIFPVPELPQGSVYVVSASAAFQIGTPSNARTSVAFKVAGGPAALTEQLPGGPLRAKTVLSLEGTLNGRVRLSRSLLIGADIGYLTIFESATPVMGIVPGISLTLDF